MNRNKIEERTSLKFKNSSSSFVNIASILIKKKLYVFCTKCLSSIEACQGYGSDHQTRLKRVWWEIPLPLTRLESRSIY